MRIPKSPSQGKSYQPMPNAPMPPQPAPRPIKAPTVKAAAKPHAPGIKPVANTKPPRIAAAGAPPKASAHKVPHRRFSPGGRKR